MHVRSHVVWLTCTVAAAASVSLAFNISTTGLHVSTMEQKDFFRDKVLQFLSGENKGGGSEALHRCLVMPDVSPTHTPEPVKYFGLSAAEGSTRHRMTVCSPDLNSVCYKITDCPAPQECTKKTVDLVFLIDGSGSMTQAEFNKNKDFIVDIINSLKNSSIKFAAVQFSFDYRKVFDFNDYQAGTALNKLQKEVHMKSLTFTHKALKFVLEDILENPAAGASPEATKVLLLITDGDPSDTDRYDIIKRYDEKNILRFVIGVKVPNLDKFKAIASQPTNKYAFKIENYAGLTGILENFEEKILLEVARAGRGMDESGFSAVFFNADSPHAATAGSKKSYVNSVCYHRHQVSSVTPASQECPKKTVDLVFLIDGSGSVTEAEFNKSKDFIVDIIDNLKNSSIKFAAVQFSLDYRKVFDFNDYQAGTALDKLQKEPHMRSLTNTHKALKFVLEDILENPAAGASPEATKVLLLITDGDPSDADRYDIIKRYDEKNILRFVIGVKVPNLNKFKAIASQPTDKHAFKIENYAGLTGILEIFEEKILLEVARAGRGMDESGFSAVFFNDTLILNSVRSSSWRSSLQETPDSDMQTDSYSEYSISLGKKYNAPLYFTGSPRLEDVGQVVLLTHDCRNWRTVQRLYGDQIGSYFGAELCSVDIDSDGDTDFLLVGAPLFYHAQEKREGQIYVYTLTEKTDLKSVLNVTAPSTGRFGTTISSLADLNGDGLRDVAVGAPLEDENRGAVYVYLGDRHRGIRSVFSQRIMGRQIQAGLRFFGHAIDGDVNLEGDRLPAMVIGSQGAAFVVRGSPVFNVMAQLSFEPEEISTETLGCLGNTDEIIPMVTLKVCFEMVETTKSKAGVVSPGLNISYTLEMDPSRQAQRAFFSQTDREARILSATHQLRDRKTCSDHSTYIHKCVDTSSPVSIRLNFIQTSSEPASVVLSVHGTNQPAVEVPFKS